MQLAEAASNVTTVAQVYTPENASFVLNIGPVNHGYSWSWGNSPQSILSMWIFHCLCCEYNEQGLFPPALRVIYGKHWKKYLRFIQDSMCQATVE